MKYINGNGKLVSVLKNIVSNDCVIKIKWLSHGDNA